MHTQDMETCVDDCLTCYLACTEQLANCLKKGGEHASFDHMRLMMDCADICNTAVDFMLRKSAFHRDICALTAAICDQCAADCDRFSNDPDMQQCADVCRRCAASCRAMIAL